MSHEIAVFGRPAALAVIGLSDLESPISPGALRHRVDLPNDGNFLRVEFEPPTFQEVTCKCLSPEEAMISLIY